MSAMAFQITSLTIVYSTVYSGADQRKHQSSVSLAFVRGIHRWPVNPPTKGQQRWKCFPLMTSSWLLIHVLTSKPPLNLGHGCVITFSSLWMQLLVHATDTWGPSQYPKRRLSVRSRKVSKPRDLYLELSDRSEIWQALRQQCCRCACQSSKRYDNLK